MRTTTVRLYERRDCLPACLPAGMEWNGMEETMRCVSDERCSSFDLHRPPPPPPSPSRYVERKESKKEVHTNRDHHDHRNKEMYNKSGRRHANKPSAARSFSWEKNKNKNKHSEREHFFSFADLLYVLQYLQLTPAAAAVFFCPFFYSSSCWANSYDGHFRCWRH